MTIDKATKLKPLSKLLAKVREDFTRSLDEIQKLLDTLSEQELLKIFSFSQFRRFCREQVNQADLKYVYKYFGIENVYRGGNILETFLTNVCPQMWENRKSVTKKEDENENRSDTHSKSREVDLKNCELKVKEILDGCIDFIMSMDIEFKLIMKIGSYNHLEGLDAKVDLLFSFLDSNNRGTFTGKDVSRVVKPYKPRWT